MGKLFNPALRPITEAPRGVTVLLYSKMMWPLWNAGGPDFSAALGSRGTGTKDGCWLIGYDEFLPNFTIHGFQWTHFAPLPSMFEG